MDSFSLTLVKTAVRYLLFGCGAWLMERGMTPGQWDTLLTGIALVLLVLLHEGYTQVLGRLHLNTALGLSYPTSQNHVASLVQRGVQAPLIVHPDVEPRVSAPVYRIS